ncbi:uncharacterized protein SPPG_02009 [Spizellomyces punctatus DAOM BR117]|uniref:CCHC-type domain-containing protein n=1 Tax=Spizellomyces punctatus (strain DAOM BR117) TaxID=645134 RepID=A0A0L0HQ42_SPIPD|nr:uncharacterized protein SPPG_02009 [Spizellomyces punctatus DAOM BR117]KND02929.1 hypothetical protein SPPG_02009 [Spizellomyces punctatus DAOM BR117]|eukprot:XP_016610968.1 hypothetical protein SPPG_02009 [Spizellomyces punctatus DAOM BR117]
MDSMDDQPTVDTRMDTDTVGAEGWKNESRSFDDTPMQGETCHNCGAEGHKARDCTEPRKPRQGETCRNCGDPTHYAKDCPLPKKPKEGTGCMTCGSSDHYARDCPERTRERTRASDEELIALWESFITADDDGEFDEIRRILLAIMDKDPDETWPGLEKRLQPRMLPPNKELADNQGHGNKRYEITFIRNPRVLKFKLKDDDAKTANAERLKDAGTIRERFKVNGKFELPDWQMEGLTATQRNIANNACLCSTEHRTKECSEERERPKVGICFKVVQSSQLTDNRHPIVPSPTPGRAVKKKGTRRANVLNPTLVPATIAVSPATSKQSAPSPANLAAEEGHLSKDCTEPRRERRPMKCHKCHQEGHKAADCTESGGDYSNDGYSGGYGNNSTGDNDVTMQDSASSAAAFDSNWNPQEETPQVGGGW